MAKIWRCKEGKEPTIGGPWLGRTLHDCEEKLELKQSDFLKDLPKDGEYPAGPRFGNPDDPIAPLREYKHIVVEIDDAEAARHGWKPGYYLAPMSPKEAERRLMGAAA